MFSGGDWCIGGYCTSLSIIGETISDALHIYTEGNGVVTRRVTEVVGVASSGGCGFGEEDNSAGVCIEPTDMLRGGVPPDHHYTDAEGNSVVPDAPINEDVANYYLSQIGACSGELKDILGIDSPWNVRYVLTNNDFWCGGVKRFCMNYGTIWWRIDLIEPVNPVNLGDPILAQGKCNNTTAAHEISHLLRSKVANLGWLEEGMAEYTTYMIQKRRYNESDDYSRKVFSGNVALGEIIDAPFTEMYDHRYEAVWLESVGIDSATIGYRLTPLYIETGTGCEPGEDCFMQVKINKLEPFGEAFIYITPLLDGTANVDVYDKSGARLYDSYCTETGFSSYYTMKMEGGLEYTSDISEETPYTNDYYASYPVGWCFWTRLAGNFGEDAVNRIVQSMVEFSKLHQDHADAFPFLQTVMDVTGMSEDEARELFWQHYASTANSDYMLGGICW